MKKQSNIDFEIVNTLLAFCGSCEGRTVSEMKASLALNNPDAVIDCTVSWMIDHKLIVKTAHRVRNGRKLPTTFIKHPSLREQTLSRVA